MSVGDVRECVGEDVRECVGEWGGCELTAHVYTHTHTHTGSDLGLQHIGSPRMKDFLSCEKSREDYAFIHTGMVAPAHVHGISRMIRIVIIIREGEGNKYWMQYGIGTDSLCSELHIHIHVRVYGVRCSRECIGIRGRRCDVSEERGVMLANRGKV